MAVSAGMALASTGTALATGTLAANLTFAFGYTGMAAAASHFLVTTALGAALNALTPKPSTATSNRGYNVTQNGSALDHQIIYGRAKVGGARVFDSTTGSKNKLLHRVLAFTGHEIEAFEEIYINDARVTHVDLDGNVLEVELPDGTLSNRYENKVRIRPHLGSPDQSADGSGTLQVLSFGNEVGFRVGSTQISDQLLNALFEALDIQSQEGHGLKSEVAEWTDNHKLQGIAYLYVRLKYDADAFPNGVPEITATIKGKKVYDPRTDTTVWSDNPALCMRDYLISTTYGLGEDEENVDDAKVISAADVCDQTNTPDSSTRYTCNGAFTTASTPYDTLSNLLTSMGGLLWYAQGKWRMKPAYWTEPTLTLDEDDLRSSFTVNTRHSRRDNYNTVKGTFRGEESNWQVTDYPEVSNPAFLSADNQQESSIDLSLPFTDTAVEARRIANVSLERNRQQLTLSGSFGMRAFQLQVGDNIKINNTRFGFVEKEFEVTSWTFGLVDGNDLQVQMILREVSESVFDDVSDGVVYERDNTTLLSPFDVPVLGLTAAPFKQILAEKLVNSLSITTSSDEFERVDLVEVEIKQLDTLVYDANDVVSYDPVVNSNFISVGTGELGSFVVNDLDRGHYSVRARAINTFGIKGDYVDNGSGVLVDAFAGEPEDVTGFSMQISGGTVFFSWTPVLDLDLSYYKIKHNPLTSGATWENSTTVIEKVARPATSASLPARSGTFLIKAVDKGRNESENAAYTTLNASELPALGVTEELIENPLFSGSKANVSLDTTANPDELVITDLTASNPSGTYEFGDSGGYIDTISTRVCRITGFVTFNRHSTYAQEWDNIPQDWDTWAGNWDQWDAEGAPFSDHQAAVYVAATDDDPSASPTWGAWQLANGSDVVGRAFKFKAELTSTNTNVSPSVETLRATVEY